MNISIELKTTQVGESTPLMDEKMEVVKRITSILVEDVMDEDTRTSEMLRDVIKFCKELRKTDF